MRLSLLKQARAAGYELAYNFEINPGFAAFAQTAARSFGLDHATAGETHHATHCLEVVWRSLGSAPDREYWTHLPVAADASERAGVAFAEAGIPPTAFVVGMHPSYSGLRRAWRKPRIDAGRRWPEESFARLARGLCEDGAARGLDLRVVMDLLPEEAALGERIVRLAGGAVTMMALPPDFQRYKATLARMDLLVTTDTGAMHVAGAVGTRLVALFGISDPNGTGALVPPGRCIAIRAPERATGRVMADITPAEVRTACQRFLPLPSMPTPMPAPQAA